MKKHLVIILFATLWMVALQAVANNLRLANLRVEPKDHQTAYLKFDITWENSWRKGIPDDDLFFHDAAWVFFKVQPTNSTEWLHVTLVGSGITPEGYATGISDDEVEIVVPEDKTGMFIRRKHDGAGTLSVEGVKAIWNFSELGISKRDGVHLQAFGIEMVYVAKGAFYVGDGEKDAGQLFEGGEGSDPVNPKPFRITSSGSISCGDEPGKLWGASQSGNSSMGGDSVIPADFPNGYNAFYCMKYLITQGQYADFLNTLAYGQQLSCCPITETGQYMYYTAGSAKIQYRNTIQLIDNGDEFLQLPRQYVTTTPDRICNHLSWQDVSAFFAWSGLRPMTELEFEKACRGPIDPIPGEFAWGTVNIVAITELQGVDGSGTEYYKTGNVHSPGNGGSNGPMRAGIFVKPDSTREQSGVSYWGITDLSGQILERVITIGNNDGRGFSDIHGNGTLTATGSAGVTAWPDASGAGVGFKGGHYAGADLLILRVSERIEVARTYNSRSYIRGGRAVRTAP